MVLDQRRGVGDLYRGAGVDRNDGCICINVETLGSERLYIDDFVYMPNMAAQPQCFDTSGK